MEDEEALGRNKSIASIAVGNAVVIYVSTQRLFNQFASDGIAL